MIRAAQFVQHIDITAEGIRVAVTKKEAERKSYLRWEDIRLFALLQGTANSATWQVEVAGEDVSLRWKMAYPTSRFALVRPSLPMQEYQQRLLDILMLVAAKTNLPFYDLRDS